MRKISTVEMVRIENFKDQQLTIGLLLGDRFSHYCILNEAGEVIAERNLPTTNWHRAKIAQQRVRMEGWRQRWLGSEPKNPVKKKTRLS